MIRLLNGNGKMLELEASNEMLPVELDNIVFTRLLFLHGCNFWFLPNISVNAIEVEQ